MRKYELKDEGDLHGLAESMKRLDLDARRPGAAPPRSLWSRLVIPALAVLVVALMVGVAFAVMYNRRPLGLKLAVPDVVGKQVAAAKVEITKAGLRVKAIKYDAASRKPAGTVIGLEPAPGAQITVGGDVIIKVAGKAATPQATAGGTERPSATPPRVRPLPRATEREVPPNPPAPAPAQPPAADTVAIPNVIGMVASQALSKLMAEGLKAETAFSKDARQPDRIVLAVEPKPGMQVTKGSVVRVTINSALPAADGGSAGRASLIQIKNYTGKTGQEAVQDLWYLGVYATYTYETSRLQPAGYVLRTTPAAGSRVAPGSPVLVIIAE